MRCERCGDEKARGLRGVTLGCGHREMWCGACYEPVLASRAECDGCRMTRYRAGRYRWYEDGDECRAELARFDAQHGEAAAS